MDVIRAVLTVMVGLLFCGSFAIGQVVDPAAPDASAAPSDVLSEDDGWLDISGFLDEKYGFLPVVMPITTTR